MRASGVALLALLAGPAPAGAATTVSKCTFAKLGAAAARGGEVRFACSGSIRFTKPIQVGSGRSLTLDGTGQSVTFDGRGRNQLFVVERGGTLTLVKLTLTNAKATGSNGLAGKPGAAGTPGAVGPDGAIGTNGNPASKAGTPGADGAAGQAGGD